MSAISIVLPVPSKIGPLAISSSHHSIESGPIPSTRNVGEGDTLDPELGGHLLSYHLSEKNRPASLLPQKKTVETFDVDQISLEEFPLDRRSRPPSTSGDKGPALTAHLATPTKLTRVQHRNSITQFLSLCWCIWLLGWNDGATGPLLPRIQAQYKVGFTVVSMIFIGNCFGYICGAGMNVWLNDRFGIGKVLVLGATCQLAAYAIIIPAPPFPLLVCAYVVAGFGLSLQNAQANGFVGSLQRNMTTKLGILHGSYGLGAFTSPFAATYFSGLPGRRWTFLFLISAFLAVVNIVILISVFRFRRQEEILSAAGQDTAETAAHESGNKYKQIFGMRVVHLLAVFALIYIGVEVTLGGWIVTFIIRERHGGRSAGYISSGFFGGLTLGRVGLMWLNKLVGERRVIFFYAIVAIGLELTIWFVPSIIGNAIAVSFIGLVLGPMFPLLVFHMTHILPQWLLTGIVGLVTGIGVAGSAALPFITGILASKFGISSMQPLMISMMVVMVCVWALIPNGPRRVD